MDSMTYLDFAENDYKYFMHSYESGYVANNGCECTEYCREVFKTPDRPI